MDAGKRGFPPPRGLSLAGVTLASYRFAQAIWSKIVLANSPATLTQTMSSQHVDLYACCSFCFGSEIALGDPKTGRDGFVCTMLGKL